MAEYDLSAVSGTVTSLVSFGTSGVVVQRKGVTTATLFTTSGQTTLSHTFSDAAVQTTFNAIIASNHDIRLIQA